MNRRPGGRETSIAVVNNMKMTTTRTRIAAGKGRVEAEVAGRGAHRRRHATDEEVVAWFLQGERVRGVSLRIKACTEAFIPLSLQERILWDTGIMRSRFGRRMSTGAGSRDCEEAHDGEDEDDHPPLGRHAVSGVG